MNSDMIMNMILWPFNRLLLDKGLDKGLLQTLLHAPVALVTSQKLPRTIVDGGILLEAKTDLVWMLSAD
jgi:hypothetical protein